MKRDRGWRWEEPPYSASFAPPPQLVFASICRSFWECSLVALDDITVTHGDCQITAGNRRTWWFWLVPTWSC